MQPSMVWNHSEHRFHDERRKGPTPGEIENRRKQRTLQVDAAQLDRYHRELDRTAASISAVKRSARRLRHGIFLLAVAYIALAVVGSTAKFTVRLGSASTDLTLAQISLVLPIVMGYLILTATRLSCTRLRLDHAHKILARYIDRFGSPTA